ncbi:MAG: hypothetical protein NVSMB18_23640 [Acetobacteraceae bacterium]
MVTDTLDFNGVVPREAQFGARALRRLLGMVGRWSVSYALDEHLARDVGFSGYRVPVIEVGSLIGLGGRDE